MRQAVNDKVGKQDDKSHNADESADNPDNAENRVLTLAILDQSRGIEHG
jgi:hypothetical protein